MRIGNLAPRAFARLCAAALFFFAVGGASLAANVVAIGDSLTAEYDTIPEIEGFPNEATRYAEITVPGWESRSWVEVVRRTTAAHFNFGGFTKLRSPWPPPRLSGYEYNWGIPGISVAQYEDFVTSDLFENPGYFALRKPLESQLRSRAHRVVIWLGTNEFRANYGRIYDGGSSDALIAGLIDDLERVIDFVKGKNGRVQIVVANIPDLGATPSRKAAHPDPARRARVTEATESANARIANLAAAEGIGVADVYSQTARLVQGVPTFFGAVEIINDQHPDNHPRYHFTRDGLHPNTPSQIEIARLIIAAFNQRYAAGIPQINDLQALRVLGINSFQPFLDWLAGFGLQAGFKTDSDGDTLTNLVEYGFGLNPAQPDADHLPASVGGPVPGFDGSLSIHYQPDPARTRHVAVQPQYSTNGTSWKDVPSSRIQANPDGMLVAAVPAISGRVFLRLKLSVIPPSGSTSTRVSAVVLQ